MRVVVLGGGPGGYVAAIRAAQMGAEVTLIERKYIGGTCLNVGCIPTKVLLHTAELLTILSQDAKELGIKVSGVCVDWNQLQSRKEKIIKQLTGGIDSLLKSNGVAKIMGNGIFLNKKQIEVALADGRKQIVDFDAAIIATGSEPTIVPIPGVDAEGVITSDEALSLKEVPKSMCIIGGGVIGSEFASIYSSLGCSVTMVEMLPDIVATMDKDVVNCLKVELAKAGVKIYTGTTVESIEKTGEGMRVAASNAEGKKSFAVEKVLLAIGRRAVIKGLRLEEIGINLDRGRICVNRKMQTNIENIYAVGDCKGGAMLAHVASAEGILAAEAIMKKPSAIDFKTIPYCVYTKPEMAAVGLTERQAKEQGYQVKIGVFPLHANGKSMIMGETHGVVKYVVDAVTDEILGLHMAGPRATDLIVEGALAIRLEATVNELITTIHAHPTVGESLHEAAHAVHHTAIHLPKHR